MFADECCLLPSQVMIPQLNPPSKIVAVASPALFYQSLPIQVCMYHNSEITSQFIHLDEHLKFVFPFQVTRALLAKCNSFPHRCPFFFHNTHGQFSALQKIVSRATSSPSCIICTIVRVVNPFHDTIHGTYVYLCPQISLNQLTDFHET